MVSLFVNCSKKIDKSMGYLLIRLVPQPNSVRPSVKLSEQEKYIITRCLDFLRMSSNLTCLTLKQGSRVEAGVRTHVLKCCVLGWISIPKTPAV